MDASLYWLARMLEAGEDPLYVARRLVRFASEDVGLADPCALALAMAAKDAVHFIGMPEGALALAEIVVYLALAPKSNALYTAYGEAVADVRERPNEPPPLAIRNAPTKLMKDAGYGTGYRYAHDLPEKTAGPLLPARRAAGPELLPAVGRGGGEGAEGARGRGAGAARKAPEEEREECIVRVIAVSLFLSDESSLAASHVAAAPVGLWHAELVPSVGHEVFFDVKIVAKGAGLSASLLNGASEIPFTSAAWDGAKLTLELAHYDAKIVAGAEGRRAGRPVHARHRDRSRRGAVSRVPKRRPRRPAPKGGASVDGSWGVEMGGAKERREADRRLPADRAAP